jgi:uridine kinase
MGLIEQKLQHAVSERLREILNADSQQEFPVVQSVSLFFWQNLSQWISQIALVPEPFIMALAGPSGSGKSFVRETLVRELSQVSEVASFTQDNYYRNFETDFPHLTLERFYDEIDFDDPAHIRFRQLGHDLDRFKSLPLGSTLRIPFLRFGTPDRKPGIIEEGLPLTVTPFVVTEGIHAFHEPSILPLYDFKIYVDVDEATRRERWLDRNRRENRGTTDNMWNTTVECLHEYLLPMRTVADLVLNNNVPQAQVERFLKDVVSILASPLAMSRRDIA